MDNLSPESLLLIRKIVEEATLCAAKPILTADEAAKYLDLEKSYLYKLTSSGILPFSKPNGKKIFFLKEDLIKWALTNRSAGSDERAQQAATYVAIKK